VGGSWVVKKLNAGHSVFAKMPCTVSDVIERFIDATGLPIHINLRVR
jgi:hypothetical protein